MLDILIAGDLCPCGSLLHLIETQQYDLVVGNVKKIIEQSDYSLVNLECPVVDVHIKQGIAKCGPSLRTTPRAVELIKYAGFNGVTLANNHFLDFGTVGVQNTLQAVDAAGLDHMGGGMNLSDASAILYKEIKGVKIAFVNCCEHEFSIATDTSAGANPLNIVQLWYTIREAKSVANKVIVIVHGGHELFQFPSPRMQETYRFFVDAGASAVINHHQHCYSGYEVYRGAPIFYGLGNFCFDKLHYRHSIWNEGYMVKLYVEKSTDITFEVLPYTQCDAQPTVSLMQAELRFAFNEHIAKLNAIIADVDKLKYEHEVWMDSTDKKYTVMLEPYSNRWFVAAYMRGLLPSFINEKRLLRMINYVDCEAHRDRLLRMLKRKI